MFKLFFIRLINKGIEQDLTEQEVPGTLPGKKMRSVSHPGTHTTS